MQTEVFYDKSFQPNGRIAVEAGYNPEPGVREKRTVIVLPPRKKRNNVVCHRGVSTGLTRTISVLSSSMVASGFIDSIEDTVEVSPWRDLNYLVSLIGDAYAYTAYRGMVYCATVRAVESSTQVPGNGELAWSTGV